MSITPERSDLVAGPTALIAALAANYHCGHCDSTSELGTDAYGLQRIRVAHDPGCPVLAGTLSAIPDAIRAATGTH
ncbi:hypothetical protein [Streptomyces wuyuanensis]|uniref:hypothetical protein n=1 Tax=Streptomyces wuyuanensis TaxID=1196353 RepID=UPI00341CAA29